MSARLRSLTLVVAALLAAPLAAQQVHVVDILGGGDFTRVLDAINAAADGDTLLIRPGTYLDPFGLQIIDGKSLVLIGDGAPTPEIMPLIVRNLAAGQTVLVRGLTVGPSLLGAGSHGIAAEDNAGVLWVENCTLEGDDGPPGVGFPSGDGAPGLSASNCEGVTVVRSVLIGGHGATTSVPPFGVHDNSAGGPGLVAVDSDVTLHGCTVFGGLGGSDAGGLGLDGECGGHGAHADGSTLVLSDVSLQGGDGGSPCPAAIPGECQGGDGLRLENGSVVYHQQASFAGGVGGLLDGGGPALPGSDRVVGGGSQQVAWGGSPRSLQISAPVREFELGTIRYEGEPGDTFGLFLSVPAGYTPLLGKQGVFALGFPLLGPVLVWSVAAPDGVFEVPFEAWDMTSFGLESVSVYGQCFLKDAGGTTLLSGPGGLTILGAQF